MIYFNRIDLTKVYNLEKVEDRTRVVHLNFLYDDHDHHGLFLHFNDEANLLPDGLFLQPDGTFNRDLHKCPIPPDAPVYPELMEFLQNLEWLLEQSSEPENLENCAVPTPGAPEGEYGGRL